MNMYDSQRVAFTQHRILYVTWNRNSMHCEPKYCIHYHDWLKNRKPGLDSGKGKELFVGGEREGGCVQSSSGPGALSRPLTFI